MAVWIWEPCGVVCFVCTHLLILYANFLLCFYWFPLWHDSGYWLNVLAFNVIALLAATSHARCAMSDPGYITKFSAGMPMPLMKQLSKIVPGLRRCQKCDGPKPPRAHHCSACGRCVMKMDHHCPWVNNCVGLFNQKHFLLFLMYTAMLCGYTLFAMGYGVFNCKVFGDEPHHRQKWIVPSTGRSASGYPRRAYRPRNEEEKQRLQKFIAMKKKAEYFNQGRGMAGKGQAQERYVDVPLQAELMQLEKEIDAVEAAAAAGKAVPDRNEAPAPLGGSGAGGEREGEVEAGADVRDEALSNVPPIAAAEESVASPSSDSNGYCQKPFDILPIVLSIFLFLESIVFGLFTTVMMCDQISCILTDMSGIDNIQFERSLMRGKDKDFSGAAPRNHVSKWSLFKEVFGEPVSWRWFLPTEVKHTAHDKKVAIPVDFTNLVSCENLSEAIGVVSSMEEGVAASASSPVVQDAPEKAEVEPVFVRFMGVDFACHPNFMSGALPPSLARGLDKMVHNTSTRMRKMGYTVASSSPRSKSVEESSSVVHNSYSSAGGREVEMASGGGGTHNRFHSGTSPLDRQSGGAAAANNGNTSASES